MTRFTSQPVTKEIVQRYATENPDFKFELSTLRLLKELKYQCQHGGFYVDPIERKDRQYDLKASIVFPDEKFGLFMSVECKHLSDRNPLVVHCVPRTVTESHHELVETGPNNTQRIKPSAYYRRNQWVGKSLDNVRYEKSDGENPKEKICGGDSRVYERYLQAVQSCNSQLNDVFEEVNRDVYTCNEMKLSCLQLPVLVVPDGCLYEVRYSTENADPVSESVHRSNLFLGVEINAQVNPSLYVTLSHLEIMTHAGLKIFTEELRDAQSNKFVRFTQPYD